VLFGLIFGFLLQKGGVAKFHVLIGQLLLVDFTVLKVMMSAVVVGAFGVHFMHQAGLVKLHLKATRFASNIMGGLMFGVGFAFAAYCPGTGAAALGQGNFDAIAMMLGMIGGSYLFAEASGWIGKNVDPIGDRGKITLPDLLKMNRTAVVFLCVAAIVSSFWLLNPTLFDKRINHRIPSAQVEMSHFDWDCRKGRGALDLSSHLQRVLLAARAAGPM
jgi:uncharacterized protein